MKYRIAAVLAAAGFAPLLAGALLAPPVMASPLPAIEAAPPSGDLLPPSEDITGGVLAPPTAWAAKTWASYSGYSASCTAEQISASWVLTARHCTDSSKSVAVYPSTMDQNNTPGEGLAVDHVYYPSEQQTDGGKPIGAGDIALLHLARRHPLASYAALNLDYQPEQNDQGFAEGYAGANVLKRAAMRVTGFAPNGGGGHGGMAIKVTGEPDHTQHGDSGGPFIINDKVVGVLSTGGGSSAYYMSLARVKDWIVETATEPATGLVSAVRGADGWITITGWAEPGSVIKTTNDPRGGWFDLEGGRVRASEDGSFSARTKRTVDGQAVVQAFGAQRTQSNAITPAAVLVSAVRGADGWITITGWAEPGSVIKTTNDPRGGWFDLEGGRVRASEDGSFSARTKRTVDGQAVVQAFGAQRTQSNAITPAAVLVSAVRGADGWITITGWAEPGSVIKTTNDPRGGWFDLEGGRVRASEDGSFSARTKRTVDGQAVVQAFGAQRTQSNAITP
ncbi:trypsin-like serine protease [Leifsonia sp. ZF2019]|nr:trypsin-like serine protease [Leifsonia sp. ZF2019]